MNSTQVLFARILLFILLCLYSFLVFAQPDYDFRNKQLLSGVDNQTGAVYRFNNVRSGVDAKVTILDLTNGLTLSDIDGGGGFVEALQPVINIPPMQSGYAEFQIDFLEAGTNTPMNQVEIPLTPIDVDGQTGYTFEYDMVQFGTGYTNFDGTGNELQISYSTGWVTGTNIGGITYDGIDTVARQVMFTVVNSNRSSLILRVGAKNVSTITLQRLRSVYFKKFDYPNSVLPVSTLQKFSGVANEEKIKLQWLLTSGNIASNIALEKAYTTSTFKPHAEFWLSLEGNAETNFSYTDVTGNERSVYYRLKITEATGKVQYSNILHFTNEKGSANSFTVYPSQVSSSATVKMRSAIQQQGFFEVFDYTGRAILRQSIGLQPGENNIRISDLDKLPSGNYITTIRTKEKIYSQKINKL